MSDLKDPDVPAEIAWFRQVHMRLVAVGLHAHVVKVYRGLARRYPQEARRMGSPFAKDPGARSQALGIDFDRWLELGLRERAKGVTRAEAAELMDLRTRYQEALAKGRLPGGEGYFVTFPGLRYASDEDRAGGVEEPPEFYPCGNAERDIARLAELHVRLKALLETARHSP